MNDTIETTKKRSKALSTDTMRVTVTADMIKELSAQKPESAPVTVKPRALEASHAGLQTPVVGTSQATAIPAATAMPQSQPQVIVDKKKIDVSFIVAIIGAILIVGGICIFALNAEKYDGNHNTSEPVSE